MSQIMRFVLLVALIAAVSAGIYWWFEEQQEGPVEETVEELNGAIEELEEPPR